MSKVSSEAVASLRHIPLSYDHFDSEKSTLELVHTLYPEWKTDPGPVKIVRFTDGIMNTTFKIVKQVPGRSEIENDTGAVLLRAYGNKSSILIDRETEIETQALLSERQLATPLIARFNNGLFCKFLPGRSCTPQDMTKEPVWRGIADLTAQWHAKLPIPSQKPSEILDRKRIEGKYGNEKLATHFNSRNVWTVLQRWISELPAENDDEINRNAALQKELDRFVGELYKGDHDYDNFVFGHCDLLTANIIIPSETTEDEDTQKSSACDSSKTKVHFIDYEYASPCPPAFDLANHFSEWGGFDCDYNMLPARATRRAFIEEYLRTFAKYKPSKKVTETEVDELMAEVDWFRGLPGFYWGIWALVQATISFIDFDCPAYSKVRLAEFWAWREEEDGSRIRAGKEMPLRERKWAQED